MKMPESCQSDRRWPTGSECLFEPAAVSRALDAQAERLMAGVAPGDVLSVIGLMTGGMYPVVELARRLPCALRIDYVHATRYREATRGGEIHWRHWPDSMKLGDRVLLVDDIFDEGHTMAAVKERLEAQCDVPVTTVVLVRKQHQRGLDRGWVDDAALDVPDRYVFGCGMDYEGLWRQLDGIWALPS
jgi:hypoxanthine phosphoribosyltransferase